MMIRILYLRHGDLLTGIFLRLISSKPDAIV